MLEDLKAEVNAERKRVYLERFGNLPEVKFKEKELKIVDFN